MSIKDDYTTKLDVITAIPSKDVLTPIKPMDVFLQAGDNLYAWSLNDKEQLVKIGVPRELIEDLPTRVGAARHAQSLWMTEFKSRQEAAQQWKVIGKEGFALCDMLLHTYRYAFREHDDLLAVVAEISDGYTREDMVQDLNDLSVLGKDNLELLNAIAFDTTQLDLAAQKSEEAGDVLAAVNGDVGVENPALTVRNRAYTHLKQAMDEIKKAGKYLFWKNEDRIKGYMSNYN